MPVCPTSTAQWTHLGETRLCTDAATAAFRVGPERLQGGVGMAVKPLLQLAPAVQICSLAMQAMQENLGTLNLLCRFITAACRG